MSVRLEPVDLLSKLIEVGGLVFNCLLIEFFVMFVLELVLLISDSRVANVLMLRVCFYIFNWLYAFLELKISSLIMKTIK